MSYIIIYGYDSAMLDIIKNDRVILIDPFPENIEAIVELQKKYNIIFLKKILTDTKNEETIIYKQDNNKYSLNKIDNYIKKHKVFTTNLDNILNEYNIFCIENIYINLNISNLDNLLNSWNKFNYLFKKITLPLMIKREYLNNVFLNNFQECNTKSNYIYYTHKQIMNRKNILLYDVSNKQSLNKNRFENFIKMNDIEFYSIEPCSLEYIYEKILYNLDNIFQNESLNLRNYDIIIQFNSDYFINNKYFLINYDIKDTVLYISKEHDIIYSTKNCMHMLYEVIKSKYFQDYIEEQKNKRKKLFKIFSKKLFYEYIEKIFKLIYI